MKKLLVGPLILLLGALAPVLPAAQLRLPVNSANSSLEVQLCVQGT